MKSFLHEFKEFAVKGNAIELAVGVIVGTSFGKIVTSLVNDIIMPPLGFFLGGADFSDKELILKAATESTTAVTIKYGLFLNTLLDFLIIALVIFIVIRQINKLRNATRK